MEYPPQYDAIHDFIVKRKNLIWYVKDHRVLSEESIVEAVLNYGNWRDVQEIIQILGIEKVACIFKKQIARPRNNYYPEMRHYFGLYFKKYAPYA